MIVFIHNFTGKQNFGINNNIVNGFDTKCVLQTLYPQPRPLHPFNFSSLYHETINTLSNNNNNNNKTGILNSF